MEPLKPGPDETGESDARGANAPARDPLLGRVIAEKYRIMDLISQGGMGRVYRAEQLPLGRVCAVKVLRPKVAFDAADSAVQKQFQLEAATCARLTHANTVTLYDYGQLNLGGQTTFFMVMELVQGRTLADALRMDGPFPATRALAVAREICRSLHEAHQLGVVHRDLKPSNVMLVKTDEGERVKVLDFGIARVLEDGAPDYTQEDSVVGSPRYMSPEQIRHLDLDGRSDLYSLGVLMYLMLTGQVPFAKDAVMGTLMAHLTEPVPVMNEQTGVDAPPAVEAIVRRCLEKNPRDRFPNAQALRETLEEALAALQREEEAALEAAAAAAQANPITQPMTRPGTVSQPMARPATVSQPMTRPAAPAPQTAPEEVEPEPAPKGRGALIAGILALVAVVAVVALMLRPGEGDPSPDLSDVNASAAPVQAPAPTALTITSDPVGAGVFEGETSLGQTPLTLQLDGSAPRHYELRLAGYQSAPLDFTPAGQPATQAVTLQKQASRPATPSTRGTRGTSTEAQPATQPTRRNDLEIFTER